MPAVSAFIFDLDDTLHAERGYAMSGFHAVASQFQERLAASFDVEARMVELFDSSHRSRVFNVILDECGRSGDATLLDDMIQAFRRHRPRIELFPDAERALARLRGKFKLGIISDGYLVTQRAKVEALGLEARIDAIILTDQWGREFWKPHPRAFEEIASTLGVAHSDCVFVADNPIKDFVAPNALGWRTVMIDRPGAIYRGAAAATGEAPQHTITTLDDLEA